MEQGVRPVASSPLARIAAATQRARGGASPRPETGTEPGVSVAAEQSVEAAGAEGCETADAGVRETIAREAAASVSSARPASRVPTPADLMRSGVRPLSAAAASTQVVRLYASSASEDADPALGLDEDLRLKLLSALQGMAEEEPRKEPVKAEVPKPAAPKPTAPKPAAPQQAQPAEAAGESASAPVQKAEPQSAPAAPAARAGVPETSAAPAPKPAAPKPLRPTPALFGKVQVSAAEIRRAPHPRRS